MTNGETVQVQGKARRCVVKLFSRSKELPRSKCQQRDVKEGLPDIKETSEKKHKKGERSGKKKLAEIGSISKRKQKQNTTRMHVKTTLKTHNKSPS
jgi:hypothetical protein